MSDRTTINDYANGIESGDEITITMERDGDTADIDCTYKGERPDGDGWVVNDSDHAVHYFLFSDGDTLTLARNSGGEFDQLGIVTSIEMSQ